MKAALWFTICSFFQKGISFITAPLFTRIMATDQYGTYTVYLSWLQIFTVISTLYVFNGVNDNAMSKFDYDRDRFLSSMQGFVISITSAVFLIVILFIDGISNILELPKIMIFFMFIEIYMTPSLLLWSGRQRFEYRYKQLVFITLLRSVLNPVLGLLGVYFARDKALARVITTTLVEIPICGVILIMQFVKGKAFFVQKYWKYAMVLALPMLPHYLSGIVLNQGDRIMISKLTGNSDVALYGVAYNIGMLVQMFVSALNSALTPWIYEKLKTKDIKSIKLRSRGLLYLTFIIAVGLMLISPEVVGVFGSSKYADAAIVIPPVAGSVFFIFLYSLLSFPEFYYEKTSFLMLASLLAAALNVLLNYIFIPLYGYAAAAYTTLACYTIYSLGHYFAGRAILRKETADCSIIDDKVAIALSVLMILTSAFIFLLFPHTIVRYSLIAVGLIVAIVNHKKLAVVLRF